MRGGGRGEGGWGGGRAGLVGEEVRAKEKDEFVPMRHVLSLCCVFCKKVTVAHPRPGRPASISPSLPPSPPSPPPLSQVLVDCTQPEGELKTPEAAFARKRDALLRILTGGLASSPSSGPAPSQQQQQRQQQQTGRKWERGPRGGEEREGRRKASEGRGGATEGRADEHMKTIVFCNKVTGLCSLVWILCVLEPVEEYRLVTL